MTQDFHIQYYLMIVSVALATSLGAMVKSRLSRTLLNISLIVVVSFVLAIRDVNLGADTKNYLMMFNDPEHYSSFVEPGYILFIRALRALGFNELGYLFASAMAINILTYIAYHKISPQMAGITFALFAATPAFWLANVLVIRNGLAASLLTLLVVVVATSGRSWKAFAIAAITPAIHYSTAGFAVLFATTDLRSIGRNLRGRRLLVFSVVAALLTVTLYSASVWLNPWLVRFEHYQLYSDDRSGSFALVQVQPQHFVPILLLFFGYLLRERLPPDQRLLFRFYLVMLVVSLLFWNNVLFRDRLFLPAQFLEPLLICGLLRCVLRTSTVLAAVMVIILSMGGLTLLYWAPRNVLAIYSAW